jgi:hypothetical protein
MLWCNNNNNDDDDDDDISLLLLFKLFSRLMLCDCCADRKEEGAEAEPVGARRRKLIEPAVGRYHCAVPVQITQLGMRYNYNAWRTVSL